MGERAKDFLAMRGLEKIGWNWVGSFFRFTNWFNFFSKSGWDGEREMETKNRLCLLRKAQRGLSGKCEERRREILRVERRRGIRAHVLSSLLISDQRMLAGTCRQLLCAPCTKLFQRKFLKWENTLEFVMGIFNNLLGEFSLL